MLLRARAGTSFVLLIALALVVPVCVTASERIEAPYRLVLASSGGSNGSLLDSASLYAQNDRWKAYLADDSVCPGGERTDLSHARQHRTLACLVNWARARRGLEPLALAPVLNATSRLKALDIERCRKFEHDPCGEDWAVRIRAAGYSGAVGENLYLASGPWSAPRAAVDGWLNSAPHRAVLFGPRWRVQGLAAVSLGSFEGRRDITVWVNQFAER